jgi:hypothetical protein
MEGVYGSDTWIDPLDRKEEDRLKQNNPWCHIGKVAESQIDKYADKYADKS